MAYKESILLILFHFILFFWQDKPSSIAWGALLGGCQAVEDINMYVHINVMSNFC
jgi:hypothetical protein